MGLGPHHQVMMSKRYALFSTQSESTAVFTVSECIAQIRVLEDTADAVKYQNAAVELVSQKTADVAMSADTAADGQVKVRN